MSFFRKVYKKLFYFGFVTGVIGVSSLQLIPIIFEYNKCELNTRNICNKVAIKFNAPLPTRQEQINKLMTEEFDVLIIGGGATGSGVALDAASRGLKTCMVEKFDFASGTSSRSTKLIHGGVRYLQKAIFNLDIDQFNMVVEALGERSNLLQIAPHLTKDLPIMLPLYKWWLVPYYWSGIKMYDVISGTKILKSSYYLTKSQTLEKFPMLKKDNLIGALVYYDGQQNDARMCLSLALSAARYGAVICNYIEVVSLTKDEKSNVINGAIVKNVLTGYEFKVNAHCVVNATGPFTDSIRRMSDSSIAKICEPSSGVHIVLPGYYSPANMGLLDPKTTDGRVIFFLPWQNSTIAGTTDSPCSVTHSPCPTEEEVSFILKEIKHYLSDDIKVRRGDVNSVWSGIRPLVKDPNSNDTQSIARNHIIEVNDGLITIAGGKWTTYRHMAEETVDKIYRISCSKRTPCKTVGLLLEGAHGWHQNLFISLKQEFGMDLDVAQHLASTYGMKSFNIAKIAEITGFQSPIVGLRLHPQFPFIEAEVKWACKEYAVKAIDVLAYRTRLCFLNVSAAQEALPRVVEIMAKELNWDKDREKAEIYEAQEYFHKQMGLGLKSNSQNVPINLNDNEVENITKKFRNIDQGNKGYLNVADLKTYLKICEVSNNENITDLQLSEIFAEVDTNKTGEIDSGAFLRFMSSLKMGAIAESRFKEIIMREPISVKPTPSDI